jgi:hypothetical protein
MQKNKLKESLSIKAGWFYFGKCDTFKDMQINFLGGTSPLNLLLKLLQ